MGYGRCGAPSHASRAKGDAGPSPPALTLPTGDGAGHLWHPSKSLYAVRNVALGEGERLLLLSPPRAPSRTMGSVARQMTAVAKNRLWGSGQMSRAGPCQRCRPPAREILKQAAVG